MDTGFDYTAHIFQSPKFRSVVEEATTFFAQTPLNSLPPPTRFIGGGVYALYYLGEYELYAKLAELNREDCQYPIYIGKAVPPGWRTGRVGHRLLRIYISVSENMREVYGKWRSCRPMNSSAGL